MNIGIVGRGRELALADAFRQAIPHGSRGLLVEGEAGIGKTAVLRAATDAAAADGFRVLACVGEQAEARLSFVGLDDLIGGLPGEALDRLAAPQRNALEGALLRAGGVRAPELKAIGVAFRALLVALAEAGPVVLAIDDVQWLDGATHATIAFAARRLAGHPVGVLATVRAPRVSPDPLPLERALGPDRLTSFRLGPLDLEALRVLVETRLGHRYRLPALQRIFRVSGGNPLFALELARALGPAPSFEPGAPLPVPDSLRELVDVRVSTVTLAGRDALLAAAALSRPTPELVERTASDEGLAAAEEAGLLRVAGGRVVFAHPLFASAVYSSAASGRRRALHRELAGVVDDPEERARHLALAATPPDEDVAAELDAAAGHARARGAWDAAGELLEQARAFTPSGSPEAEQRRAVAAAEHHIHAGDRSRAGVLLRSVLDEALAGRIRSEALGLLAEVQANEESFAEAERLLDEALEHTDDPALRARLHAAHAYVSWNHGGLGEADRHAALALDGASSLDDSGLLAETLAIRAMIDFLCGRGIDWELVEQSLSLTDANRILPVTISPTGIDAVLTLFSGRHAEARDKLTVLRRAVSDSGDESELAAVLFWLAWLETDTGHYAAAVERADEGAVNAVLTGSRVFHAFALGQRALVHAHRGDAEGARADAAATAALCASVEFWQPMLGASTGLALLELSLGKPAAAWAAVRQLAEVAETGAIPEPHVHQYLPATLEALVALGELDRAERLLDWFEDRARATRRTWALATGARSRALLLAERGDLEGADDAASRALRELEPLDMPFERARTLFVQGQVRRRRRRRRVARESLEQALAVFESLGAALWAARVRDELDRLGTRGVPGALTASERRVAVLAAEGRSNKEIAAELFVTVHTVELHLSHCYAKLGIRSRTQLAARLDAPESPLEV